MFSEEVIKFFRDLEFKGSVPDGISVMNPFRDNPKIIPLISQFYHKFYDDHKSRHLILGINPGRFGAGVTGIPFTAVSYTHLRAHETRHDLVCRLLLEKKNNHK